jgi:photosystem II stability/assembly factor-like uncharacterized protein
MSNSGKYNSHRSNKDNCYNPLAYKGSYKVFDSSGGFSIDAGFGEITLKPVSPLYEYDVTDAIQILYSVRKLNDKLGIIKDESNNTVLELLHYDNCSHRLSMNNITITSEEFINSVNTNSIISMGNLCSLYSDFNYTIMKYFGDPLGFASLFNYNCFNVNHGVFEPQNFINLINGITFNITGSYITDLSGSFTINNINEHLQYACQYNTFSNRPASSNFNIKEGFLEGDLIFIPNGMKITLTLNVQAENANQIPQNTGPNNLALINNEINYTIDNKYVSKITTYSTTNITQVYSVPILLVLSNEDTFNMNNYGLNWTDMTTGTIGSRNWLAVSISANGQYQAVIDSLGDIYLSDNYGYNWNIMYNIGEIPEYQLNPSLSNCISISATGKYQTASNGSSIYTSNDYGITWNSVYNMGSSKIFVCISLSGKYQTVISCGDNMYISNNYGYSWTTITSGNLNNSGKHSYISTKSDCMSPSSNSCCDMSYNDISDDSCCDMSYNEIDDDIYCDISNNDMSNNNTSNSNTNTNTINTNNVKTYLYNSILSFQYAGISFSYNGQYQTIVCEHIYTSSDYGSNWNMISIDNGDDFNDRNWTGVSISSTGQYQTAVDNGGEIYMSSDYGNNWKIITYNSSVIDKCWSSISISANGKYQTALDSIHGMVHISIDYGNTWNISPAANVQNHSWEAVSVSANGQYQTIVENGGGVYISNLL